MTEYRKENIEKAKKLGTIFADFFKQFPECQRKSKRYGIDIILPLMIRAEQQGIAQGRAEMLKDDELINNWIEQAEKQAYEKGKADGKKEVLLNEKVYLKRINQVEQILKYQHNEMEKKYLEGRKDGVADIKARLMSKKVINIVDDLMNEIVNGQDYDTEDVIELALAEAERK